MPKKRSVSISGSKLNVVKGFTLFAQNLPKRTTSSQVHLHFSKYGKVVACHVSEGKDVYQGAEKNSALVTFENEEDLTKALNAKHLMDNRRILTSLHVPSKKDKEPKLIDEDSSKLKKGIAPAQVPLIMNGNPVIFVFGLDLCTPKAHIAKFFSNFGDVTDCELPMVERGVNKGYCYVRFASVKSVIAVMKENVLRLDNKFLSVLPSVTANKWSSLAPVIENVDVRSKRQRQEDKRAEKRAARQEMAKAAADLKKKRQDEIRAQIIAKRAQSGAALSEEQVAQVKADPVVVLAGPGVKAGQNAITQCAQKYGLVRLVYLPRDRFLKDKELAYVHFSLPSHALKLLEQPYIDINDVCVEVRPIQNDEERVEAHERERSGLTDNPEEHKIFVDGLLGTVVTKEVYGHFAVYGAVTNVDLPPPKKRKPGVNNRGFAFVTFANKEAMDSALAAREHKIQFKPVNVCLWDPNFSRKRQLEQVAAPTEEPCSKKAKRKLKKALQGQPLHDDAPADSEPAESGSEAEDDDDDDLLS